MDYWLIVNAIIVFTIAFALSSVCVPLVIKLAIKKRLLGEYGEGRHVHKGYVPRLGGVAIYIGFFLSQIYFIISHQGAGHPSQGYLLLIFSSALLFFMGVLDDLVDIKANLKFFIQLVVGLILVWQADVRIESFYGLFGVQNLPLWISYLFSITVIAFFINAYNLIDGIDSLSSSIGMYVLFCFGCVFLYNSSYIDSIIIFSVFGALLGFWLYNKPPAKIFMGDSGTLSVGLMIAYFAIRASNLPIDSHGTCSPVFAMIVLVYPVIDTLRVFTKRIIKGVSPFTPDKNHIHHLLLDLGYSHGKATLIIVCFSIILSGVAYFLKFSPTAAFFVTVSLTVFVSFIPGILIKKKKLLNNPDAN